MAYSLHFPVHSFHHPDPRHLLVQESPRYLVAQDRNEEALAMLAKYHGNGDENHPTVQFEYREIRETIKMEQAASK